ncbi:MAG: histidine ammonia-lyase [Cyclobacteriaceae bacterium]|nr:histidine ammonia-lyase [Cyclobacteriaceae bacterium]
MEIKDKISLSDIELLINDPSIKLSLSAHSKSNIEHCRKYLDNKIKESSSPLYGINTGFGSLYNKYISNSDLSKLQENLVVSHACGMGDPIPREIVKLMLVLKVQSLSYGFSGVQLSIVERLLEFYNAEVYPVIYEYGSLGASGDLAPLAHLSLPLIGKGKIQLHNNLLDSKKLEEKFNWKPLKLKAKDGLALLNGTQFMSAFGCYNLIFSKKLSKLSNMISALSLDVFDGRIEPFEELTHSVRPHKGAIEVAENIHKLLQGSELIVSEKIHVQDPYSFRCIPQVHGASLHAINHVSEVFETEINSVTDNPVIFTEQDRIISAGHFHGQLLALPLDYLAIALAELGSISERRTFQLISGNRNLPNYLVANPGINSGLMIPQYTAASLASMNKQLAVPSSTDSIVSSNGQEDHVSMGANAAVKCYKILQNTYRILAIELLTATQALFFKRPLKTSPALEKLSDNFRKEVTFIKDDRILHDDLIKAESFLKNYKFD